MQQPDPSFGVSATSTELIRSAGRHSSAVRTATEILAAQPSVLFLAVLVAALMACTALLALDARQGTAFILDQMIGATKVVVFLNPQTSHRDAETIGARLKAQPGVREAQFHPRESSEIKTADGKIGPALDELPLPDAWVLSLQPAGEPQAATLSPSIMAMAEQLQIETEKLSGVESVRFDRLWIAQLDGWVKVFREYAIQVTTSIVGALAILLFGSYFLAGRALRANHIGRKPMNLEPNPRVFTYIGLLFASLSGIAAFLLHGLAAYGLSQFVTPVPGPMQTWLAAFGRSSTQDTLAIASAIFVTALLASLIAARRHRPL